MRGSRCFLGSWALAGLIGCTTTSGPRSITADEPRPVASASAPAQAEPAPAMATTATATATAIPSAEPQPTMPPEPKLPPAKQRRGDVPTYAPPIAIGTACAAEDTARCGKKGLIAMENDPRHRMMSLPCTAMPLTNDPGPGEPIGRDRIAACVKEDRVYATASCVMCRLVDAGWTITGVIPEMTDAQLASAQKQIGLPSDPLLRTPDAWRSAIATVSKRVKK